MWPRPAVAEYRPVTFRKGVVSSARFTPDGGASSIARAGRGSPTPHSSVAPESPDARDLQLKDARILSISRAGDMAVLFGPQNIDTGVRRAHAGAHPDGWRGTPRRAHRRGGRRLDSRNRCARRHPRPRGRPSLDRRVSSRERRSMKLVPRGRCASRPTGAAWRSSRARCCSAVRQQAMITVIDKSGRKSTVARDWAGYGLAWTPSGTEIWFTATRPGSVCAAFACRLALGSRANGASRARLARAARHLRGRQGAAVSKHHSNRPGVQATRGYA